MKIAVDGSIGSAKANDEADSTKKEDLPPLTEVQKSVAREKRISEEDYARALLASRLAYDESVARVEMFGRLLKKLREINSEAEIEEIVLRVSGGRFEVSLNASGRVVPLRIRKDMIDDLFEAGRPDVEDRLSRILRTMLELVEREIP